MVRSTDLHKVFLQSLLSRRFMREEIALELYKRAVSVLRKLNEDYTAPHPMDSVGLASFMGELSTLLHDFGMDVKRGREDTQAGKLWYALVNTEQQGVALSASDYSPIEITYFRLMVTDILDSYPAYSVGSLQALKIASDKEIKMTKSDGQALIKTFVARGYLAESKRGRYSIGPRGVLDLEPWLTREENVFKCDRCKKLVFVGKACAADGCAAHFHLYCYDTVVRRSPQSPSCPACRTSFRTQPPTDIGEAAVPRAHDHFRGTTRKRKRASRNGGHAEDDEGDEGEDGEDEGERSYEEEESRLLDGGDSQSQVAQSSAGPSSWAAAGSARRTQASVVPETQL
ncbi:hypothetical protein DB88DRAFT_52336 [Papiliotrema laurentii]|uniref:Non-structural maintenance of chromosomes element 1 homolog n=1 Tax=Papiliotrema laurentii TaxID=5418 RepID=A0AAD9FXI8_PAPLA|nr:hypothetical protein DB88DRAFT_52336 [Papiliotrema laurentii]